MEKNRKLFRKIKNQFFDINKNNGKIIQNFFSLGILRGYSAIIQLILLPYLTRVLGPEKYGLILFAQSFVMYFTIFTQFGFNWSGTRIISINRNSKEEIEKTFTSIIFLKVIFCILSFIILISIILSIENFKEDFLIYLLSFGIVINTVLVPKFFFQGIEKMKYIAYIIILVRTVYIIAILIFVKNSSDYILFLIFDFISNISIGIISQILINQNFKINFIKVSLDDLKYHFDQSKELFISTFSINIINMSNIFILGLFVPKITVGVFSASYQVLNGINLIINIMSLAFFPHTSKIVSESRNKGKIFIKKILILMLSTGVLCSFFIFFLADWLVPMIFGPEYLGAIMMLKWLSPIPTFAAAGQVLLYHCLITFNHQKTFSKIILVAAFIDLSLSLILIQFFQVFGLFIALLSTQIFIIISSSFFVMKRIFRNNIA